MIDYDSLHVQLRSFVDSLEENHIRIVLAESCTAGLVAALIGQIPGASKVLCGSMVVYRAATKSDWLELDPKMLADPQRGTVCPETTRELALSVLQSTPEANWSLAITGHLGPDCPPEMDGLIYLATFARSNTDTTLAMQASQKLRAAGPQDLSDFARRADRQLEAAVAAIEFLGLAIKRFSPR